MTEKIVEIKGQLADDFVFFCDEYFPSSMCKNGKEVGKIAERYFKKALEKKLSTARIMQLHGYKNTHRFKIPKNWNIKDLWSYQIRSVK